MTSRTAQRPYPVANLSDKIIRLGDEVCKVGGCADVFRCNYSSDSGVKAVAIKTFRFRFSVKSRRKDTDKTSCMIRREIGIWKRLNHPNIVPFLGITYGFGRDGNTSLVSLWMSNQTLRAFLEDFDRALTATHRLKIMLDIANGLAYLHSFSIAHGDLSCNNVLFDDNYTARLVDFGFSPLLEAIPDALVYLQTTARRTGAVRWAAPEHFLVGDSEHMDKSDVYSIGNIAFTILSGKFPWSEIRHDNTVMLRLCQGHKPARPEFRRIEDAHWALIERCWSSLDQRPSADEVVSSLKEFLRPYPPPQPLRAFLSARCSSSLTSLSPYKARGNTQTLEQQRIQDDLASRKVFLSPHVTPWPVAGDTSAPPRLGECSS